MAGRTSDEQAAAALRSEAVTAPGSWLYGKDVLDLITLGGLGADEVVDTLRPFNSATTQSRRARCHIPTACI